MFERIFANITHNERYLDVFFVSFFFTLLSVFLAHRVMPFTVGQINFAGIMAVLFTSLAVSYPIVKYLVEEERKEIAQRWQEATLIKRHAREAEIYMSFFLGCTVAFALATFFVPQDFFTIQLTVLQDIRGPTGSMVAPDFMMLVLRNNLWVFAITFILAFFVSSAVIFVLAWNASVLGVLIGNLSASALHIPAQTLPYLPHGMLEVFGYIAAGIAGALLSYEVEVIMFEGEAGIDISKTITKDVLTILLIGVGLIALGAVVEAV